MKRQRKTTMFAATLAVAAALLALPNAAGAAVGDPEITQFTVTPNTTQAGAHPNVSIVARFCGPDDGGPAHGCTDLQSSAKLRDFILHLPPGFLGNPTAVPTCPTHLFLAFSCPPETIVGNSLTQAVAQAGGPIIRLPTLLFNVETLGFEPARLGTGRLTATPPGPLSVTVSVRTTGDYGVTSTVSPLPVQLGFQEAKVAQIDTNLSGTVGGKPFFVNPTSCKPVITTLEARSWETAATTSVTKQTENPFSTTGCDQVPFGPEVTAEPVDTTQAGAPTGYRVAIQYPKKDPTCDPSITRCETYENDTIWQSALRDADITLPEGVTLAPGGGVGLEACTARQFGVDSAGRQVTNDPAQCPPGSQIGDVTVQTPVLPTPIEGKAFFGPVSAPGRPTPTSPWKLFILLEGHGLRIKLVGDVSLSPSGQIRTTFLGQPEVPFSRFELRTRGGDRAVLANSTTCGGPGSAILTGYADTPAAPKQSVSTLSAAPTGCSDPKPFQPTIEDASAEPNQAGANSTSRIVLARPDGHQQLKGLHLSLPRGAVGSLAAVPLCPLAQAQAGRCDEPSYIGRVQATAGSGADLVSVSGSLFLAEPSAPGDAATIALEVPAKVGPIDLGNVVALNRVRLRPTDTGVDVSAGDLPTILEGVPIQLRRIEITVDRKGFFLNPTGCDPRTLIATFSSDQGASAADSRSLAATGCGNLSFGPKLRLIAGGRGQTAANSHPPLRAIVTQKPGEANIAKARVVLPDIIRPNVPQLQKPGALCNDAQLAARACPATSQVGTAHVVTPLLPFHLSGPVYIVLRSGSPLPNLAVFLRGNGIEVLLSASNGFSGIKLVNTFDSVPDVAQTRFELSIKGGSAGILLAHRDLCTTRPLPTFDATFTGQNGKTASSKPRLESEGCVAARARLSIASRVVRVTRRGVAPIRLRCAPGNRCRGRLSLKGKRKSFSIRAARSKTVKIKLNRRTLRALRRAKRMRARATARVTGARRATRTIVLRSTARR